MAKGSRGNRINHFKHPEQSFGQEFFDEKQKDPKRRISTRRFRGYEHGGKKHQIVDERQKILRQLTTNLFVEDDK